MAVRSAGLLLYRQNKGTEVEVWIAHMGGPFWERKDDARLVHPQGRVPSRGSAAAAQREFAEEMGVPAPSADYVLLGTFRQPSGKLVTAFTAESAFKPEKILSNTFPLEWPKGSGTVQDFPEIDRAEWITESEARIKLVKGQLPILDALLEHLGARRP